MQAIVDDRNSPQKHVWRARIVLATADGLGTAAVMRAAALLRKAAERTIEGLWRTIGALLDTFTPTESTNYFTAAGYELD